MPNEYEKIRRETMAAEAERRRHRAEESAQLRAALAARQSRERLEISDGKAALLSALLPSMASLRSDGFSFKWSTYEKTESGTYRPTQLNAGYRLSHRSLELFDDRLRGKDPWHQNWWDRSYPTCLAGVRVFPVFSDEWKKLDDFPKHRFQFGTGLYFKDRERTFDSADKRDQYNESRAEEYITGSSTDDVRVVASFIIERAAKSVADRGK